MQLNIRVSVQETHNYNRLKTINISVIVSANFEKWKSYFISFFYKFAFILHGLLKKYPKCSILGSQTVKNMRGCHVETRTMLISLIFIPTWHPHGKRKSFLLKYFKLYYPSYEHFGFLSIGTISNFN